jgi:glycosyltransferase involved in cell wall biosynthesis
MFLSIITSSYNSGEGLLSTVKSVLSQERIAGAAGVIAFEILVQDAGSTDNSMEKLLQDPLAQAAISDGILKLKVEKDQGVYDGMNRALSGAKGDYVLFLNCGDILHDKTVLKKVAEEIAGKKGACDSGETEPPLRIFYGDTYCVNRASVDASPRVIDGFTCFRNIPCHQSCFYDRRLFDQKKYDLNYKIRADYDHFLWCYYEAKAEMIYMDLVIADYEGGGISESKAKESRAKDKAEHKAITETYMDPKELHRYRRTMALTVAPLRTAMAESRLFSGPYHQIKKLVYGRKK